jgi:hypothetical protein
MSITCAVALAIAAGSARADERAELEALRQTTISLMQALVQQGVISQDKVDALVKQAMDRAQETLAAQKKSDASVQRIQYVPEALKKQIADQVREEVIGQAKAERWGDVNAVPEWVDRVKIDGDFRMGYQGDRFAKANAPEVFQQVQGQNITNTTEDRDRYRLRARLGLAARATQELAFAVRLATGSQSDPVSTNQTLGQYSNKSTFSLDRAFLKAHSEETLPSLTLSAGRIPNPWFSTDLLWDDDVNFEGAALLYDPRAQSAGTWRPFATLGAFAVQDLEKSLSQRASSKFLQGAQFGVEWLPDNRHRAKFGLAYYDYLNISGVRNPNLNDTLYNGTAATIRQKGNTLFNIDNDGNANTNLWALANDYQLVNLTALVDLNLYNPVHVMFGADYVQNVGFNQAKTLARSGLDITSPQTTGYLVRVAVGMPNMVLKDDWQVSLTYRYVEADAVLDAFTDSDFHLGGTNNKGFILGMQYGLSKNSSVSARWLSSTEIQGLPLSIDILQLYFNAKF